MSERVQVRMIVCGTNGTGKSTFANKTINAITETDGKRALALLPDDSEPIFKPYHEIREGELHYINNVAHKHNKIYFTNRKIFSRIQSTLKNGILIMDDAKFYSGSRDEDLNSIFIRSRQNNVDVMFICHGLSEIPPSLITYATHIILFNTVDSWQRLKSKIPNPEYFETIVNDIRKRANSHKFTLKQYAAGGEVLRGEPFVDVQTKQLTKGKPFKYKDREWREVVGVGCNAFNRDRCNCGAAYVKKVIDVKKDLINTAGL